MPRTTVITGGGGFVGQWLARALLAREERVYLAGIGSEPPRVPAILSEREWTKVRWIECDVRRGPDVEGMIAATEPDVIVHLAGLSSVPKVEKHPAEAFTVNTLGAVHVAHAAARMRSRGHDPVLLAIGSATQYGIHPTSEMPLTESAELRPVNTYAATKVAQEIAALQVGRATGLRVICTRSFNHSGVGHDESFLLPSLVARITKRGGNQPLHIGNDVIRDYLHVADVADAYLALIDRGQAGQVYNVCSGTGVSVRELARAVIDRTGLELDIVTSPALQRAGDMPILVGSPDKLKRTTGWSPKKGYLDIIDDLLAAS